MDVSSKSRQWGEYLEKECLRRNIRGMQKIYILEYIKWL